MNKYKKYFAWIFIFALVSILIPRECLHDFLHSDKSCHVHCDNPESPQISEIHKHCTVLNFSVTVHEFLFTDFQFDVNYFQTITLIPVFLKETLDAFILPELRGPPLV